MLRPVLSLLVIAVCLGALACLRPNGPASVGCGAASDSSRGQGTAGGLGRRRAVSALARREHRRKRALEIGAASGYSAIWIGMGLRQTGGRLVTIEYDAARARKAAENIRRAGLADIVQVIRATRSRRFPSSRARSILSFWTPGSRLPAVLRSRLPTSRTRRALPRPQCRQQARRDVRLSLHDRQASRAVDDNRFAIERRHVGLLATEIGGSIPSDR